MIEAVAVANGKHSPHAVYIGLSSRWETSLEDQQLEVSTGTSRVCCLPGQVADS